jgi:hypothetical protein
MKNNLRISHTIYPDGTKIYWPPSESKEKKSNTEIPKLAVIFLMLTNVVLISVLLFNYLIYNFFKF